MKEKIDTTLKKIAGDMSKASSPTSSSTDSTETWAGLAGDPACPVCHGLGYLRSDVPVGHPEFGRLQVCTCRSGKISQQVHQRLFSLSNLNELRHLSFASFLPRGRVGLSPHQADSLERAYNQSFQFAHNLNGWLMLQGKYGCGKTHLAAAIANFAVDMGVPTLFITVPDLLDTLRFAYDAQGVTFEERFEQIRGATLLVMDDFGTQNATPWAQEKLFQILNYRYINHMATVITTNLSMGEIDGRIRSRLEDPDLVTQVRIFAPDYRRPAGDSGQSELSILDLLHERTFASFDLRREENLPPAELKSLEKAFQAASDYARQPHGWLVFTGPYGCGKTHLAAAIANYRVEMGYPPLFIVVPDLLDHLRSAFSPTSTVSLDRRFEEVKTAQLLVLDDLGTQSMTPWVREKLYQLFNYRYNAELPTVITTADTLDEMDPRLRSRILDTRLCTIYGILAGSYRGTPRSKPTRRASARK